MRVIKVVVVAAIGAGGLTLVVYQKPVLALIVSGCVLAGAGVAWLLLKAGGN